MITYLPHPFKNKSYRSYVNFSILRTDITNHNLLIQKTILIKHFCFINDKKDIIYIYILKNIKKRPKNNIFIYFHSSFLKGKQLCSEKVNLIRKLFYHFHII